MMQRKDENVGGWWCNSGALDVLDCNRSRHHPCSCSSNSLVEEKGKILLFANFQRHNFRETKNLETQRFTQSCIRVTFTSTLHTHILRKYLHIEQQQQQQYSYKHQKFCFPYNTTRSHLVVRDLFSRYTSKKISSANLKQDSLRKTNKQTKLN